MPRQIASEASFEATHCTRHDRLIVAIIMSLTVITIRAKAIRKVRIIADVGQQCIPVVSVLHINISPTHKG